MVEQRDRSLDEQFKRDEEITGPALRSQDDRDRADVCVVRRARREGE